jgi:hypothetical protein
MLPWPSIAWKWPWDAVWFRPPPPGKRPWCRRGTTLPALRDDAVELLKMFNGVVHSGVP